MQAGARSSAPLRAGRCQDQQSEILLTTNPTDTSKPAAIHPPQTLPHSTRATPRPTFAGGGGQAGSQSDDDGERGRQVPLCPCHGPVGPPAAGWGCRGGLGTFASERPELRHTPAHAKALCAHCSHPHRRAARRGGRSLPVTARKPMGWVGSTASPPSRSARTRWTQREHPDRGLPLPPGHPPVSRCCAPGHPPLWLWFGCCESRTFSPALRPCCLSRPGPWDGGAVRGDRVAQRFPLWLAKQGAHGQDQAQGKVGLPFSSGVPIACVPLTHPGPGGQPSPCLGATSEQSLGGCRPPAVLPPKWAKGP